MGFPFLLSAPRFGYMHDTRILHPCIVILKTPHPRIVISSESEKSFSFAIDQEK